jgi:hypothetical protein
MAEHLPACMRPWFSPQYLKAQKTKEVLVRMGSARSAIFWSFPLYLAHEEIQER